MKKPEHHLTRRGRRRFDKDHPDSVEVRPEDTKLVLLRSDGENHVVKPLLGGDYEPLVTVELKPEDYPELTELVKLQLRPYQQDFLNGLPFVEPEGGELRFDKNTGKTVTGRDIPDHMLNVPEGAHGVTVGRFSGRRIPGYSFGGNQFARTMQYNEAFRDTDYSQIEERVAAYYAAYPEMKKFYEELVTYCHLDVKAEAAARVVVSFGYWWAAYVAQMLAPRLSKPKDYGRGRHLALHWKKFALVNYGHPSYVATPVQEFPTWEEAHMAAGVMTTCQCPPWAVRRVAVSLFYTGQFMCSVGSTEHELRSNMMEALRMLGVYMEITDWDALARIRAKEDRANGEK